MSKARLETYFKKDSSLDHALTHKSWVNEHAKSRESNERLEFLGDAILEFIVSEEIYKRFPDKEEGYLTALRANVVNTLSLAEVARNLKIGDRIHLSKGEEETGGRENYSILADTVEAIIGSIFLDSGLETAKKFIFDHILIDLEERSLAPLKDPKSMLQEHVQSLGFATPRYEVVEETGPDHNKIFTMQVVIDGKPWGQGTGKNKSEAAQNAAKVALEKS